MLHAAALMGTLEKSGQETLFRSNRSHTHTYIYKTSYIYIYIYICICVCCTYIYIYTCICINLHMYINMGLSKNNCAPTNATWCIRSGMVGT